MSFLRTFNDKIEKVTGSIERGNDLTRLALRFGFLIGGVIGAIFMNFVWVMVRVLT